MTPESMIMYDTNMMGDCMLSLDVSGTYQAIAFGDSGGKLMIRPWLLNDT